MSTFHIRALVPDDKPWVTEFVTKRWGAEIVVARGVIYYPRDLPGFVAVQEKEKVGLVTYFITRDNCEIVSLDSLRTSTGIGTSLVEAVIETARHSHCRRLSLTTTNDNLNALRFYQKRGFRLVAVHRNAVEIARQHKQIPKLGADGIPIRDEIELEMIIDDSG